MFYEFFFSFFPCEGEIPSPRGPQARGNVKAQKNTRSLFGEQIYSDFGGAPCWSQTLLCKAWCEFDFEGGSPRMSIFKKKFLPVFFKFSLKNFNKKKYKGPSQMFRLISPPRSDQSWWRLTTGEKQIIEIFFSARNRAKQNYIFGEYNLNKGFRRFYAACTNRERGKTHVFRIERERFSQAFSQPPVGREYSNWNSNRCGHVQFSVRWWLFISAANETSIARGD